MQKVQQAEIVIYLIIFLCLIGKASTAKPSKISVGTGAKIAIDTYVQCLGSYELLGLLDRHMVGMRKPTV